MKKSYTFFILLIFCSALFTGCEGGLHRYQTTYLDLFDTVTSITGYAKDKDAFDETTQAIHDELLVYHRLYDIYNNYEGMNNIKTVNDNAGIAPVQVDEKVLDMLKLAVDMYGKTEGMMNIAMGSVLSLWHDAREYGLENPDSAYLPDSAALEEGALHMDIGDVQIDEENGTVYLADPDMSLDVGAIGKGYAVQAVCSSFQENGLDHYLVSVGGNVCAIGSRGDGTNWQVGIENPDTESSETCIAYVGVTDMSVVTSGSYQRFYTVDGIRYHHIIDPDTLYPNNTFQSVTILSGDSARADILSTALFNMSLGDGQALIEGMENTEAMWVLADGGIVYSSGFNSYIIH